MRILVVDDKKENLYLLETLLRGSGYDVVLATNGAEALEELRVQRADLIISDILMPVMDGFQFCKNVKENEKTAGIPLVFYTAAYIDKKDEELGLRLGADKFIRKPIDPEELLRTVQSLLKDKEEGKAPAKPAATEVEEKEVMKLYSERVVIKLEEKMLRLEEEVIERRKVEDELHRSFDKLTRLYGEIVYVLASVVEKRDPYTAGHQERVAKIAEAIAREMGRPEDEIRGLVLASAIHDIGKITIPGEILAKPGKLADVEMSLIRTHPVVGYEILERIDFPWPVKTIVLQHHERMDGSGYPYGLTGEDIILESRIISVADVVEAMASRRPYRSAVGIDKALEEIEANKGKLYDPDVVDACLKVVKERHMELFAS
jgi:putative two-component system response regulator